MQRSSLSVALAAVVVYLAFLPPVIYSVDGNSMLMVAESLVTQHTLTVPPCCGTLGPDGHYYSAHYPLSSAVAVPVVALAVPLASVAHVPLHYVAMLGAVALSAIFTAAAALVAIRIAETLGATGFMALWTGLSFAFGTIALTYARSYYAEPLLTLLIVLGIALALHGGRPLPLFALISALCVLAKPAGVLVGPLLAAYVLTKRRDVAAAASALVGVCAGLLLFATYDLVRFGNPTMSGQPWQFSLSGFGAGLAGLVFSPWYGLIWFCPPVIAALFGVRAAFGRARAEAALLAGIFLGFLGLHALWADWGGGWSWGPRLLLPSIPALLLIASFASKRWMPVFVALTLLGFAVNSPTLFAFYERYYEEISEQGTDQHALIWSPAASPIFQVWGAAGREFQDAGQLDVRDVVSTAGSGGNTIAQTRVLRLVALWWWLLPAVGIPRWVGILVDVLLLGVAGAVMSTLLLQPGPGWFARRASVSRSAELDT